MSAASARAAPGAHRTDRELVEGCLAGDQQAADLLCRRYRPRLVALLHHLTGDRAAAEDLTHDTLVRALHYLDRFDPSRDLWPWLKVTAKRLAYDHAHYRARDGESLPPEDDTDEFGEYDPTDDVVDRVSADRLIAVALPRLPARQRAALRLRYLESWSATDAAAFLGVTTAAFKQLLFRARTNLRREVEHLGTHAFGWVPAVGSWRAATARLAPQVSSNDGALGGLAAAVQALARSGAAAMLSLGLAAGGATGGGGAAGNGAADPSAPPTLAATAPATPEAAVRVDGGATSLGVTVGVGDVGDAGGGGAPDAGTGEVAQRFDLSTTHEPVEGGPRVETETSAWMTDEELAAHHERGVDADGDSSDEVASESRTWANCDTGTYRHVCDGAEHAPVWEEGPPPEEAGEEH